MSIRSTMFSRCARWSLISALLCLIAAPAFADVTDALREIQHSGQARVIVRMRSLAEGDAWEANQPVSRQRAAVAAAANAIEPRLRAAHVRGARAFRTLPFMTATVTRDQLLSLAEAPEVESISVVHKERKLDVEKQQLASALPTVDVFDAWSAGYDGSGYAVVVIDGGFNTNHPMLAGKIAGEACFSHDGGPTEMNQCGSGQTPQIGAGAASNCPSGSTRCDHGTHVASIAVGNDGTNFGVARGAKLVPIDVFSKYTSADDCSPDPAPCEFTDSLAVLDALDYVNDHATELKVAAVNLSFGGALHSGYCDDDVRKGAIDMLRAKGIAVAIAAGNEGSTGQVAVPGCISTAETVGASTDGTDIASFSNFGNMVDLVAPGVNITAAAGSGTGFATMSGTSMASPFVAGGWAVMRSALPNATFDVMESALKQTGLDTTRTGSGVTVPKIQIMHAINRVKGRDRRIFNNVFSAEFRTFGASYVRIANPSDTAGSVTISVRDVTTGLVAGTWTSPTLPAHSSPQFDVSAIERDMVRASTTGAATTPTYFNLEMTSTFTGYLQHVAWAQGTGVLTNLTACAAGLSTDASFFMNVFSSRITDYTSRLRLVNTGTTTDNASLIIYDQGTGAELARWTSPDIAGGATLEITMPQLEAAVAALATRPASVGVVFNVKVLRFGGYVQQVLESRVAGALSDMTAKCDVVATTSQTASAAK